MKLALLTAFLFLSIAWGQESWKLTSAQQKTADSLCAERGHAVLSWAGSSFDETQLQDLKDKTVLITHHKTDRLKGMCWRCNKLLFKQGRTKPDTTIIWKREKK